MHAAHWVAAARNNPVGARAAWNLTKFDRLAFAAHKRRVRAARKQDGVPSLAGPAWAAPIAPRSYIQRRAHVKHQPSKVYCAKMPLQLWFVAAARERVTAGTCTDVFQLPPIDRASLPFIQQVTRAGLKCKLYKLVIHAHFDSETCPCAYLYAFVDAAVSVCLIYILVAIATVPFVVCFLSVPVRGAQL